MREHHVENYHLYSIGTMGHCVSRIKSFVGGSAHFISNINLRLKSGRQLVGRTYYARK